MKKKIQGNAKIITDVVVGGVERAPNSNMLNNTFCGIERAL